MPHNLKGREESATKKEEEISIEREEHRRMARPHYEGSWIVSASNGGG